MTSTPLSFEVLLMLKSTMDVTTATTTNTQSAGVTSGKKDSI